MNHKWEVPGLFPFFGERGEGASCLEEGWRLAMRLGIGLTHRSAPRVLEA